MNNRGSTFVVLIIFSLVAALWAAPCLSARETIRVVKWSTSAAAPPPKLDAEQAAWLPMLRLALANLNESQIIEAALANPSLLGLAESDAARLRNEAAEIYREMSVDPLWRSCPSLLAYCYAERQPAEGMALVVTPANGPRPGTPVVIFLHGDGGLFTWYAYRLHKIFPDAVLVLPAYGVNPAHASPAYLEEAFRAAWSESGSLVSPIPHVVGLSAGGFAVQRAWMKKPAAYTGILVLGAYAPAEVARGAPYNAPAAPWFVVGADEPFVRDPMIIRDMSLLRRRVPLTTVRKIPAADHFFLLTHRDASAGLMREWLYSKHPLPAK